MNIKFYCTNNKYFLNFKPIYFCNSIYLQFESAWSSRLFLALPPRLMFLSLVLHSNSKTCTRKFNDVYFDHQSVLRDVRTRRQGTWIFVRLQLSLRIHVTLRPRRDDEILLNTSPCESSANITPQLIGAFGFSFIEGNIATIAEQRYTFYLVNIISRTLHTSIVALFQTPNSLSTQLWIYATITTR